MLTPEQIAERRTGVGGSDSAVVLNVSPWKTSAELWAEKRGLIEPDDLSDNEAVHFGNVLEDTVAAEYARRRSLREGREVKVRRVNRTLRHKQHPFMLAHLDRDVVGEPRILECKTADLYTAAQWGEEGTDEIPTPYWIQAHHYLAVTGAEMCDVAVLIGGNRFRTYCVRSDPEFAQTIVDAVVKFWQRVQNNDPVPVDPESPRALEALRKLYPGTNGKTVPAPPELLTWRETHLQACALKKEYETAADIAKAHLLRAMGDNAVMEFADGYKLTRKLIKRKPYVVPESQYVDWRVKKPKAANDDEQEAA